MWSRFQETLFRNVIRNAKQCLPCCQPIWAGKKEALGNKKPPMISHQGFPPQTSKGYLPFGFFHRSHSSFFRLSSSLLNNQKNTGNPTTRSITNTKKINSSDFILVEVIVGVVGTSLTRSPYTNVGVVSILKPLIDRWDGTSRVLVITIYVIELEIQNVFHTLLNINVDSSHQINLGEISLRIWEYLTIRDIIKVHEYRVSLFC